MATRRIIKGFCEYDHDVRLQTDPMATRKTPLWLEGAHVQAGDSLPNGVVSVLCLNTVGRVVPGTHNPTRENTF